MVRVALDRVLDIDEIYKTDFTDNKGNIKKSVTNNHSIFSPDEQAKLAEAKRLINEVRNNYKATHYQMRPNIK